ncbi:ribonuclease III domain-containing protein [Hirsutella rhossiliensis]|uniref:Ribonuclease III domain-containing protein n=1 Tax=Hirsutella rhossiliensis TaxID=111463 RepID=A0A9P8N4F6_9HYPO|nr:ribonuclease III domain-containing protein [Hirsutella rhossiliensis]KAH0968228.1 ribonuclease III domain-containing protein [Hirsutella rhossiliensis]
MPGVDSSEDESEPFGRLYRTQTQAAIERASTPEPKIREHISAAAQDAPLAPEAGQAQVPGEITSRAYQLEMLEQSLKQSVIVVMDTGSGKTQIAVLRIKAELERASPDKIIWFLAPTVSLCGQQFNAIGLQITSTRIKLLTGNENVDTWNADTWDLAMEDVRIVVSTYQILLDALSNAFLSINRLALIIFDEAHNCVDRHPGSKVMANFYHRRRDRGGDMPCILGLTATPSMRSNFKGVETLEAILHAKCVSPTVHRETLLEFVKKPEILCAWYTPQASDLLTKTMQSLLQAEPNDRNLRSLAKAIERHETYSQNQIKGLWNRCVEVHKQLGPWAADLYLWNACKSYLDRLERTDDFFDQWSNAEKRYVADFLRRVSPERPSPRPQNSSDLSDKVTVLLQELLSIEQDVVGIIFIKERSTVTMLCEVLASCPRIVERYRIGCMVGGSTHSARKRTLYEFWGETNQTGLQDFRSGAINLLVGTSVLEEGIDIPACNLIVCFDKPHTPKAFVQRRGRARMGDSRLVWLTEQSPDVIQQWEALEEELKHMYEDEEREIRKLEMLQDSEPGGTINFEVESTGALLDLDNAKQHLQHFCSTVSKGEFIDSRPDYVLQRHWDSSPPRLSAAVLLPPFVPGKLRRVEGKSTWLSEKSATKDAAFQAYVALYRAGLVSEHLLPLKFDAAPSVETRAPEIDVEPPFDPWYQVARDWNKDGRRWLYALSYQDENQVQTEYEVLLPVRLDQIRPIELFLDVGRVCQLQFGLPRAVSTQEAAAWPDQTSALLAVPFAHRWHVEDSPQVVKFTAKGVDVSREQIGSALFDPHDEGHSGGQFLVRDQYGTPFLCNGQIAEKPPIERVQHPFTDYDLAPSDEPYLILRRWTKRFDFLHRLQPDAGSVVTATERYPWVLPQSWALLDEVPARHAKFGMMIPSIAHELQVMLTAKELATTILQRVAIADLGLVREAISARSASEPVHYERLEFLGDSILKYCTSVQAAADHPEWPEGYLSGFRDGLISNSRLCRAAIDSGLAKFILTKRFTGKKWRPLYVDGYLQQTRGHEKGILMSTKTLADVVEALIGASYIDGGVSKAVVCMSTFLRECEWRDVRRGRERLFHLTRSVDTLPPVLEPLEKLVGYSFQKKELLIEAVTHASYVLDAGRRSYERLEFLGDAVLDHIVVTKLFGVRPPLPHYDMHTLKTAMVNADFLALVVMENGLRQSDGAAAEEAGSGERDGGLALWNFMRHASPAIGAEQGRMRKRHGAMRTAILETMERGTHYPWALLARMQAKKFFSDLFEALLGAVWIDSGSKETCEAVVARFGILSYLERLLGDKVEVQHPKQLLGKLAVADTVTYDIDAKEGNDGEKRYLCTVLVGDRVVAEVDDGVSREEVQTKAAHEAVGLLKREQESSHVG